MLKKLLLCALLTAGAALSGNAQVQNCAVTLPQGATVDFGAMPQLDGLSSYTLQMWVFPARWHEGATVLSRGADLRLVMERKGKMSFCVGSASMPVGSLKEGEWNQITLICDAGQGRVVVNGTEAGTTYALPALAVSEMPLTIGSDLFEGRVDEIRLWDTALNNDLGLDYFAFNTLNKWNPDWAHLLNYYKMDQDLCPDAVVDYKAVEDEAQTGQAAQFNNHGIMRGGAVKQPVTDNLKMPYLVNSAYTANERFFDRVIPADQYLLSNDIINLGIVSERSGHLHFSSANNHATPAGGATYAESYQGRDGGLLRLDGTGYLDCPSTMIVNPGSWEFETWLYLDEWSDGATLFAQENDDHTQGLYIGLGKYTGGDEPEDVLVVRVNGNNWRYPNVVETGRWMHLSVQPGGGTTVSTAVRVLKDGGAISNPRAKYHDGGTSVKPEGYEGCNGVIGRDVKGCLDNTMFWGRTFTPGDVTNHMRGNIPMPSLNGTITSGGFHEVTSAYYTYNYPDDPERGLGYSSHSQDEWLSIMKSAFDGYRGAHFYISVKTPPNTPSIDGWLDDAQVRRTLAADLAVLSEKYDGVELDLEWAWNWTSYSKLATEIRSKLPEGKKFRISTHNVSYGFPVSNMDKVDGFTFQQYGPQSTHFFYSHFVQMCNQFVNYGYDRSKIMTSYSTTTSNGSGGSPIKGVKDGFFDDGYTIDMDADTESKVFGGETYWYTGPYQTYKRARHTRQQNLMGIFYWDMGNDCWDGPEDNPTMGQYNLAKWCSYGLNANVDRLVTSVEVNHSDAGVSAPLADATLPRQLLLTVSGAEIEARLADGTEVASLTLYSLAGATVAASQCDRVDACLPAGVYIVEAVGTDGSRHTAKLALR